MCYANFESHIRYGIIFCGSSGDFDKAFKIQKMVFYDDFKFRESCKGKLKKNFNCHSNLYTRMLAFLFKNNPLFCKDEPQHGKVKSPVYTILNYNHRYYTVYLDEIYNLTVELIFSKLS